MIFTSNALLNEIRVMFNFNRMQLRAIFDSQNSKNFAFFLSFSTLNLQ